MKKEVTVVMIPTNKKAKLYHDKHGIYTKNIGDNSILRHNLFFLSDEEFTTSDYTGFDDEYFYHVDEAGKEHIINKNTFNKTNPKFCRRIVATTDTLEIQLYSSQSGEKSYISELPRPSNEFLQRFCESGGVDKVLVKYVEGEISHQLKVSPDNTISTYFLQGKQ